jgi:hypothetical protein
LELGARKESLGLLLTPPSGEEMQFTTEDAAFSFSDDVMQIPSVVLVLISP